MDDSGLAAGFGVSPQEIMKAFGPIQLDGQGTYYDAMLMIAKLYVPK